MDKSKIDECVKVIKELMGDGLVIRFDKVLFQIKQRFEFRNSIDANFALSETTRKNYLQNYKKFINKTEKKITDLTEDIIIETLRNFDCMPKTKNNMLCVVLLVRKHFKLPIDKIRHYKGYKVSHPNGTSENIGGELWNEINKHKIEKKIELDKELPTKKELIEHLNQLYKNKKYNEFLVNYLLINHGLRNLDLNMIITNNKKVILKSKKNISQYSKNYLYPTKTYSWVIINIYKTQKTFGRKRIRIRDTKFLKALNETIKKQEFLIVNPVSKSPVPIEGLGRVIQDMTYNKIGEGKIFKTIVKDIFDNVTDVKVRKEKLNELSVSRGTAVDTIIQNYATGIPV